MGSDLTRGRPAGVLRSAWKRFQIHRFQQSFRKGAKLSRFIAPDVRRDIEVIDDSLAGEGRAVAKVRTVNVLHLAKGMKSEPDYGPPEVVSVVDVWKWNGPPWGGREESATPSIPVIEPGRLERLLAGEFPSATFATCFLANDYGTWQLEVKLDVKKIEFVWGPLSGFGGIDFSSGDHATPFDHCDEYLHSMDDALSFARRCLAASSSSG